MPILITNVAVPQVTSFKCLGVKLDENLKWDNLIELICSKVGGGIATIKQLKTSCAIQVFTNYL